MTKSQKQKQNAAFQIGYRKDSKGNLRRIKKLNKRQLEDLAKVTTEDEMLSFISVDNMKNPINFTCEEIMSFLWDKYYITFRRLSLEVDAHIRKLKLDKQYILIKLTDWYDNCYGE